MEINLQNKLDSEFFWRSAEEIADRIISGQSAKNFDLFSTDFTPELRAKISQENFIVTAERFDRDYGDYQCRKPLGVLNGITCIPVIWLVNFEKTEQDFLFQIRLIKLEDRYLVGSVLFKTWIT